MTANLDATNHTIATLSWTENGEATSWVLQYGTNSEFGTGTYEEVTTGFTVEGTTVTANLTGLTTEAFYYARVKPDCDTEGTKWSTTISFWPTATVPVVVNNGTATNISVPFYSYYIPYGTPNKSQFIIPAANLEDINIGSTIKRMTLHSSSSYSNVSWGNATFNVYLKEVDESNFASATFVEEGLTNVYSEGKLAVVNNEMEIIMDHDFIYNGGNLLVGIELADKNGFRAKIFVIGSVSMAATTPFTPIRPLTAKLAHHLAISCLR